MLKNNTPAFAANAPTDPAGAAERSAYQGSMLLTANRTADTDTWRSGLNNNVLVLGSSGCGKTRNHLKPNLLQAQGSYIVLDSKGILYREMAPYLRKQGYQVDQLDFVGMNGTLGYNPLDHIRCQDGHPAEQDIIAIASALCPREDHESDPFWALAAANYLTSYIAYVLEAMPEQGRTMAEVIRVFDEACSGHVERLFDELERKNPGSYAVKLRRRAQTTIRAERMHASIVGIIAALIMNKTVFRGKPVPFVMELPNYRMPGLKSVALLLWEKAKDFLQRAFTVIFLATIIIWFLQSFDTRLNVVADSAASLLALIGRWIAPIFRPLGFGDWRCATALISGFIAKESVVSTLQVLLGGAAISSLLSARAAVSFLVFTLLYTPCVAAIATIRRELDSRLKTVGVVLLQCTVAWIVACAAYAIAGML